jgi:2-amino-4-hydroxy-6-hydroxymethyldihydropteridine diphosphokinase
MNEIVVALGSNIEPEKNIPEALQSIADNFFFIKKSQFIYTEPRGYKNQPDFLNGAVLIKSKCNKAGVIRILKEIERKLGRQKRALKNGPRKIDLDLIVFNRKVVDEDVFDRDFLQRSILELLPQFDFSV